MKELKSVKNLNDLLKNSGDKLVVIDFFADWCGPCRIMGPKFEKMASEYPDVVFAKVNIQKAQDLVEQYAISSIPHFKFFKNRKVVDDVRGADEEKLKEKINKWKDAIMSEK
ncbi:glycerol ether metabolic process [Porites harrisoni]